MHGHLHQESWGQAIDDTKDPSLRNLTLIDRSQMDVFDQIRRLNENPMRSLLQEIYMRPPSIRINIRVTEMWKEGSELRQESWDAEWTLVEEVFKERGIELVTSQEIPEAEKTKKVFIATFPAHHIPAPKAKGEKE